MAPVACLQFTVVRVGIVAFLLVWALLTPARAVTGEPVWILRGTVSGADGGTAVLENGRGEALWVHEGMMLDAQVRVVAIGARAAMLQRATQRWTLQLGDAASASGEVTVVNRLALRQWLGALPLLLDDVRARPVHIEGQVHGYQVHSLRVDGYADRLGLRDGDVLTHVNGQALTSTADLWRVHQELQAGAWVQVELLRHARPVTLNFRIS